MRQSYENCSKLLSCWLVTKPSVSYWEYDSTYDRPRYL